MSKGKPIKAVLDARHVAFDLFGHGHSAHIRKLVYMYLATWADPDGTDAFPGLKLIATDCGLTVRGLSNVLEWLAQHALIAVEYKASHLGTNRYTVLLTDEALKIARQRIENDEAQVTIRVKAESARQARSKAAKSRWAKKRASADVERSVLGDVERSIPGDVERSILGVPGTECIGHGTGCIGHGTLRSTNRPLDRPPNRERDRQQKPAKASLPVQDAADAAKVKTDLLREYTCWRDLKWPKLSLTIKERDAVNAAVLSCGHDLATLQRATSNILDALDVTNSYDRAGDKLAAGLADKADAITTQRKRKRQLEAAVTDAIAKGDERLFDMANEQYRRFTGIIGESPRLYEFERRDRAATA